MDGGEYARESVFCALRAIWDMQANSGQCGPTLVHIGLPWSHIGSALPLGSRWSDLVGGRAVQLLGNVDMLIALSCLIASFLFFF